MRRIHAGAFVSLDGVMQAPGGPEEDPTGGFTHGGWVAPYWDETAGESMAPLFKEPFDLLLGRRTYEIFAAYWPYNDDQPIGRAFNQAAKYVVTSSRERCPGPIRTRSTTAPTASRGSRKATARTSSSKAAASSIRTSSQVA